MPQFDRIIDITDMFRASHDGFVRDLTPEEHQEIHYPNDIRLDTYAGERRTAWGVINDFEGRLWVTAFNAYPRERFERLLRRGSHNRRFR